MSVYRLVFPALVLSILVTGLTFVFNEAVVPVTNYQASVTLNSALNRSQDQRSPQASNIFYRGFSGEKLSRLFYARRFDGRQMQDLTVLDFARGGLSQIVVAKSGQWNNGQHVWDFFDGTIYDVAPTNSFQRVLKFQRQQLELPRAPLDLATQYRQSDEMNIAEAQDYLQLLQQSADVEQVRKLRVRIQGKYALPTVCLVFGLVGASLGIQPQRRVTSTAFGLSVVISFGHYLFSFICSALGEANVFSPFMAAWLPIILGLAVGWVILNRAAQ